MQNNPLVNTAEGPVFGTASAGQRRFLGIPYAQPPVGDLRFAAPAAPVPRAEPFDATLFGPPPPQLASPQPSLFAEHRAGDDWLTLNVWTSGDGSAAGDDSAAENAFGPDSPPKEALPVMVWIHGGSFTQGGSAEPTYDGGALAKLGVVVVTINYRVGLEGFTEFPDAPSNRGLLDQIAALTWVRDNISAFGGDPEAVTVFGESAGAGSILPLLTMPLASGLFQRAILQSVPAMIATPELAASVTETLAGLAGIPATAEAFSKLDPAECSRLNARLQMSGPGDSRTRGPAASLGTQLCPVVDGTILPEDPWEALRRGAARDIDLMVSHTRDEYRLFMIMSGAAGSITEEQAQIIMSLYGPGGSEDGAENPGAEEYRRLLAGTSPETRFECVRTDRMFTVPTLDVAEAQTTAGGAAHVAFFAMDPVGGIGSPHAIDTFLTFDQFAQQGNIGSAARLMFPNLSEADRAVGQALREAWTAFARTGDPGWQAWDEKRQAKIWGGDNPVTTHPFIDRWQAFRSDPSAPIQVSAPPMASVAD